MARNTSLHISWLSLLIITCGKNTSWDDRELIERSFFFDETIVNAAVSMPTAHKAGSTMPLILALHPDGGYGEQRGRDFLLDFIEPALGHLRAILVAPTLPMNGDWVRQYNEDLVLSVIDTIIGDYDIDLHRILVTGYSMGGTGAWHFLARYPEIFGGAIAIACFPDPRDTPLLGEETPILAIHGSEDGVFPLRYLEDIIEELSWRRVPVLLQVEEGLTHADMTEYILPLTNAAPWIRLVWGWFPD